MIELRRLRKTPFLISPPFGTYFKHDLAKRVLGSLTLNPRPGRWLKVLQFLLDNYRYPVREDGKQVGWRNRIELRNGGVCSISKYTDEFIYSIVGLEEYDWRAINYIVHDSPHHGRPIIELNAGCRNVHGYNITFDDISAFTKSFDTILKLPADREDALRIAEMGAEAGVIYFHAGNTVPDNPGSLSGYPAKKVNLPIVEELAKRYKVPIIGGGGIYILEDIADYRNVGAVRYSLASVWMKPWQAHRLIRSYQEKYGDSDIA